MEADRKRSKLCRTLFTGLLIAGMAVRATAAAGAVEGQPPYSPYVTRDFPRNLYWGDTHLHTRMSSDAYGFGGELMPEDAYALARGETVRSNTGQPVRLHRPLDFLVVADHAEYLGVSSLLDDEEDLLKNSPMGQRWLQLKAEGKRQQVLMDGHQVTMGKMELPRDPALTKTLWARVADAADRHNEPGRFTAFIGYEWTSLPEGNNLHRNIIFRDDAVRAKQVLPFSAIDSQNPEDLWRYLQDYEEKTGGRVMAIPHNGNVSNGMMFRDRTYAGEPLSPALARARSRWEPLVEVTQIKGDGETHPYLSPDDAYADFETWDMGNFALPQAPKEDRMLQYEYARSALKLGLQLGARPGQVRPGQVRPGQVRPGQARPGVNPFKFGMIGSTDAHTALPAVEEDNFFGKFAADEPSPGRAQDAITTSSRYAAAGYAAVWAADNTRETLFDAMQRREVYASTGPRMVVRFFGGWTFDASDHLRPDYTAIGYRDGVPMGGDLPTAPPKGAPRFLVAAFKDPEGANLERVQIVKGWLDAGGNTHEKVYDVALSDVSNLPGGTGQAPPLQSTVETASATYTNTVGAVALSTVWTDPRFNPAESAFYYVRVLEIPTPRWTTYDAAFYSTPLPDTVPAEIQERAYTSPIWYTPGQRLH